MDEPTIEHDATNPDLVRVNGIHLLVKLLCPQHARDRLLERYDLELEDDHWIQIAYWASKGAYPDIPGYAAGPFCRALHVPCGESDESAVVRTLPIIWREQRRRMPFGSIVTVLSRDCASGWPIGARDFYRP